VPRPTTSAFFASVSSWAALAAISSEAESVMRCPTKEVVRK
jgi:hypothetical protein